MRIRKAFRNWWVRGVCFFLLVIVVGTTTTWWVNRMRVTTSDALVSISMGSPQEYVAPVHREGGLPIRAVTYNEDVYVLRVEFNGREPLEIEWTDIRDWSSVGSVEEEINTMIGQYVGNGGYGEAHVYSISPFRMTTKFSKNQIEGEWWK